MNNKVAIVYDWIDSWGGVERLLLVLHEMFPGADWFTSFIDYEKAGWARKLNIKSTWMQALPDFVKKNRIICAPLFPYAFESFDFAKYDLVFSVSSCFAKGVITRPGTRHISYILTPARFLWTHKSDYNINLILNALSSQLMKNLREWDVASAYRPDKLIAISHSVADRCSKIYRRDAEVLYPPFDIEYWRQVKVGVLDNDVREFYREDDYYLVVSRLESYKKIQLAIEACRALDHKLVVVGSGRQESRLRNLASKKVSFMGNVTDSVLAKLYMRAKALLMPQEEDFGYTSLEAQYFGCPVIAYRKGGAMETVIEGKTGILFDDQSVKGLKSALEKYHTISYNIQNITKKIGENTVSRYSKEGFKQVLLGYLK